MIIFCKWLSMVTIFSSISDLFYSFFPVLSSFFQFWPDKTGRNRFLPLCSGCPGRNRFLPEETQPCKKSSELFSARNLCNVMMVVLVINVRSCHFSLTLQICWLRIRGVKIHHVSRDIVIQTQTSGKLLDLYRTGGPVTTWKIQVLLVLQNFYRT